MERDAHELRERVGEPPRGMRRLRYLGPGLVWMLSSVGSGAVLFTPRVGSRYGYELLWIAVIVVFLQWVMIREVGRYTIASGRTLFDGFRDVPGPRGWAIWAIFLPQIVAAVVTIAGIASLAGSALAIALPGPHVVYGSAVILASIALVIAGKYQRIEKASAILSGVLVVSALVAAVVVIDGFGELVSGAVPGLPDDLDWGFAVPWFGFLLAGAAGVMWFSYWVSERGFGEGEGEGAGDAASRDERIERVRSWNRTMNATAAVGVVGGGLVIVSFLVLGAEILRPQGVVPEGIAVAEQLTDLLSEVWGAFGRWVLLIGVFVALSGTVLANQDGWGRMFADATALLARKDGKKREGLLGDRKKLTKIYAVVTTAALPLVVFWIVREPVTILEVGGVIAAAHTPVVVGLVLYLVRKRLPGELRPGGIATALLALAGLFFLVVAAIYFFELGSG